MPRLKGPNKRKYPSVSQDESGASADPSSKFIAMIRKLEETINQHFEEHREKNQHFREEDRRHLALFGQQTPPKDENEESVEPKGDFTAVREVGMIRGIRVFCFYALSIGNKGRFSEKRKFDIIVS